MHFQLDFQAQFICIYLMIVFDNYENQLLNRFVDIQRFDFVSILLNIVSYSNFWTAILAILGSLTKLINRKSWILILTRLKPPELDFNWIQSWFFPNVGMWSKNRLSMYLLPEQPCVPKLILITLNAWESSLLFSRASVRLFTTQKRPNIAYELNKAHRVLVELSNAD